MRRLFAVTLISFSLLELCSCGKKFDSENTFGSEVVSQGWDSEDLSETDSDTQDKENDNEEKIFTQDFDGTVMTIITNKSVYSVGETIYVTASLENTKSEDIYLYYSAATRDIDESGNYLVELVVNLENWYKEPQDPFSRDEPFVRIPVKPGEKHIQYYQFQPYPAVVSQTPLGGCVCYPDLKKAAEPGVYNGNFRMWVGDNAKGVGGTRYTLDYFVTLRAKERTDDASDGMPGDESVVGTEDKKSTSQETEAETVSAKGPITVVTKETRYDFDGSMWYRIEYEYDRAGNRTKETHYEADGSMWYRAENEYDRAGNRTKMTAYWPDGYLYYREEYEYDSQGKMAKQTDYWADGSLGRRYEYEYDSSGNLTKQTEYRANGRLDCWYEYEYEYDSLGNLTKQTEYFSNWATAKGSMYEYEYDSAGNLTKMTGYIAERLTDWEEYEYEYDSAGNQTKMTSYDSVGSVDYWKEYEYMTIER